MARQLAFTAAGQASDAVVGVAGRVGAVVDLVPEMGVLVGLAVRAGRRVEVGRVGAGGGVELRGRGVGRGAGRHDSATPVGDALPGEGSGDGGDPGSDSAELEQAGTRLLGIRAGLDLGRLLEPRVLGHERSSRNGAAICKPPMYKDPDH